MVEVNFCDSGFCIAVGNIAAAQSQAQQAQAQQAQAQAQAQAQSGAGNPTTMVPNPPGSVPVMAAGAASLAAALIKGHQQQQQQAGKKGHGVMRMISPRCLVGWIIFLAL